MRTLFRVSNVLRLALVSFLEPVSRLSYAILSAHHPLSRTGHCKKLAPEYEELGKQFSKDEDGIVIAKVRVRERYGESNRQRESGGGIRL